MKILDIASAMNPYKWLFTFALCAGVVTWGNVWYNTQLSDANEAGKNSIRAEYALELSKAKEAARIREADLTTQRDKALENANERQMLYRAFAGSATSSSNGLRDDLATLRNSLPGNSEEALRHSAYSLAIVLADCQERYRALAERADGHAGDVQTLNEAYPQNPVPAKAPEQP